jgi:serine/threonine protein kinase
VQERPASEAAMTEQSWSEKSIFLTAVEIESAAGRAAFLDTACAGNPRLRAAVEALLEAHERPQRLLDIPVGCDQTIDEPRPPECPGLVIGPYRLLETIGEGGMGVVFMAEQQYPVRRKVAVKVLEPGMDTRQVVARFEAERQALALMDHPNIVRVFDGGETTSGRPFFVMELVRGIPITEFCDQHSFPVRARLELFVHVCEAVQHAHVKGVIHRDLKPSNVLVTLHDDKPVVKVIDFGIAKAIGQQLTEKTLFTGFAQMIGTPLYMSPEQAALNGLDVDTRSDIYSLGVLLYELLTGTTPFEQERLRKEAYDQICRIIREEEPTRPSTRITTLGQAATVVSANRRSDPKRLRQLLRGELDWIVMKAMEKDRSRRYETAAGLARDLECFLRDEPVQACPPSILYRSRRWVRRNRTRLAIAAPILLSVVLLSGGAVQVMWERAARLAATEREVQRALDEADTLEGQGKWPEALGAAQRGQRFLASGGSDELRQRAAELRQDLEMVLLLEEIRFPTAHGGIEGAYDEVAADARLARAFREYGIDVESLEPEEAGERVRARKIRFELALGLDHWIRLRTAKRTADDPLRQRLFAVARAADPDPWRNQLRDALEHRQTETLKKLAASAKTGKLPVQSLSLLAWALDFVGAGEEAVVVLRQAVERYPDDFWINFQLAWSLDHLRKPHADEVIRFYTAARALRPRNFPVHMFLAQKLRARGKEDEALAVYRRAIDVLRPDDAAARVWLGSALRRHNQLDEAIAVFRKGVALHEKEVGIDHPSTLGAIYNLALAYEEAGQSASAVSLLEETLEKVKARLGPDHSRTLDTLLNLALAYQLADRLGRAEDLLQELLERRKKEDPQSLATASGLASLGWTLLKQQRYAAAEPILRECLTIRLKKMPDHCLTFNTRSMLGGALLGQQKYAEAEPLLLEGYQGMKRREATIAREGRARLIEALERLEQLYRATGQKDEADVWARKLEEAKAAEKKARTPAGSSGR